MPDARDDLGDRAEEAVRRGLDNLRAIQAPNGAFRGDYGGPVFLVPMYVALHRIAGIAIPDGRRSRMIEYLFNVQNGDGSLGLHCEGPGSMFSTATGYAALRALGAAREEPRLTRMREWVRANGTALGAAQWGKFFLALLNLNDYAGLYPIPPELWLLPEAAPIHPSRLWCHARVVYLPMAWLYGTRSRMPVDDLCIELREDLYDRPYSAIRFEVHRDTVAPVDLYRPATPMLRAANQALLAWEAAHPAALRRRALALIVRHIDYEDGTTGHVNLGPVNAILNRVVHFFRDPTGARLRQGWSRLDEYVWDGHDGVKVNGYQSTELWDTAFAAQAVMASPFEAEYRDVLDRAHDFVRENQVLEDTPDRETFFRHRSKGGWPFSTRLHGWPITDCTSEGLKVAIACEPWVRRPVPEAMMRAAVDLILSFQNDDGGWATYERQRVGAWLEMLNPSQVFGDIMVDCSYTECTSACMQALSLARSRFPGAFDCRIGEAMGRGERFLRGRQREDGSWEGSWGVCFTYGTWFGISGLVAAGARPGDPAVERAVSFLLDQQRPDGSWGEHHQSCTQRRYVQHRNGQAVMTSWAVMALVRAGRRDLDAARRGVEFLMASQGAGGGWPREAIAGVFNKTCMINYDNYRQYFPVWAISEWLRASGRA